MAASSQAVTLTAGGSNSTVTSNHQNGNGNSAPSSATGNKARQNDSSNGSPKTGVKPEETAAQSQDGSELDKRIAALQETVGAKLYRWVAARVRPCQPAAPGARCPAEEEGPRRAGIGYPRVATHGSGSRSHSRSTGQRLAGEAAGPLLNEIADMPTLVQVVQGLESIVNGSHPSAG